jgi:hypothetical protein
MTAPWVAFTDAADGDPRHDPAARRRVAVRLRISDRWAVVRQVHGAGVVAVDCPGDAGEADALWSATPSLPLAVFTADCLGVALRAEWAVGVAHAGWRGVEAGVVPALIEAMRAAGAAPVEAVIGPGIGPCCFEVGAEVADRFPAHVARTRWGSVSVDLAAAVTGQLGRIPVTRAGGCTCHESGYHSHRRDGTSMRMAALAWRSQP